jgi:DNA repair photolyase
MKWPLVDIELNGIIHKSIAPIILSASRSTDIPAFYAKQFMESMDKGWLFWTNPFNGKKQLISLSNVRFIVFWTKNPIPILPHLKQLDDMGIGYYFNYNLNDYVNEGLEIKLPSLEARLNQFIEVSEMIGKEKVVWRFDPLILLQGQNQKVLLEKIYNIAGRIHEHTEKIVVSFIDTSYRKVNKNFKCMNIEIDEFIPAKKREFAANLYKLLKPFKLKLTLCACEEDLSEYNIFANKCIDDELILRISKENSELVDFIKKLKNTNKLKDTSQREHCLCIVSKDIGAYRTCRYSCLYCYAGYESIQGLKSNRIFT